MKIIDKLAWIEIKDGKILSTKSFGKEKYYIPGGKREAAEYTGELKASSEIEWVEWLNYADLERVSAVDKIIFKQLKEQGDLH